MKTFTFRYDPSPRKTALAAISKAMKTGKGQILDNEISCRDMDQMMKVMTKSRFQIFTAIVETSPESITELSKQLGKNLGNVTKDVKALEVLGLLRLDKEKGIRGERQKPIALYDRIVFECEPKRLQNAG